MERHGRVGFYADRCSIQSTCTSNLRRPHRRPRRRVKVPRGLELLLHPLSSGHLLTAPRPLITGRPCRRRGEINTGPGPDRVSRSRRKKAVSDTHANARRQRAHPTFKITSLNLDPTGSDASWRQRTVHTEGGGCANQCRGDSRRLSHSVPSDVGRVCVPALEPGVRWCVFVFLLWWF